ncbi:MAG: acyl-CoA dehydrogenase family protein [Chloroflexota bacterium]
MSAVGIARAALEFTIETLKKRASLLDYTKPKHALTAGERDIMEMEARYKSAWLLTFAPPRKWRIGRKQSPQASIGANIAPVKPSPGLPKKRQTLLGPLGYSRDMLAEKWMRDAKINDIYEAHQANQPAHCGP